MRFYSQGIDAGFSIVLSMCSWRSWVSGKSVDSLHPGLQVLIVQFGGEAFSTVPLDARQWAACIGIGALTLPVRAGLLLLRTGDNKENS